MPDYTYILLFCGPLCHIKFNNNISQNIDCVFFSTADPDDTVMRAESEESAEAPTGGYLPYNKDRGSVEAIHRDIKSGTAKSDET